MAAPAATTPTTKAARVGYRPVRLTRTGLASRLFAGAVFPRGPATADRRPTPGTAATTSQTTGDTTTHTPGTQSARSTAPRLLLLALYVGILHSNDDGALHGGYTGLPRFPVQHLLAQADPATDAAPRAHIPTPPPLPAVGASLLPAVRAAWGREPPPTESPTARWLASSTLSRELRDPPDKAGTHTPSPPEDSLADRHALHEETTETLIDDDADEGLYAPSGLTNATTLRREGTPNAAGAMAEGWNIFTPRAESNTGMWKKDNGMTSTWTPSPVTMPKQDPKSDDDEDAGKGRNEEEEVRRQGCQGDRPPTTQERQGAATATLAALAARTTATPTTTTTTATTTNTEGATGRGDAA